MNSEWLRIPTPPNVLVVDIAWVAKYIIPNHYGEYRSPDAKGEVASRLAWPLLDAAIDRGYSQWS